METGKEMLLSPEPVHDWIYIEDFISGMLTAAEYAKPGEIVNIGTGREHTNLQILETLQRIAGKQVKYKASTMRDYDTTHWCADIKKLLSYGWKQKYPLGLGLAKVYEFYKAKYA
jgi:nucleoside-diphosphate-sugar epimerase